MIITGQCLIAVGILLMFIPAGIYTTLIGLILTGLGCAPIYPSVIHSTPELFGDGLSGSVIGVQMASAYIGTCLMPPLFGIIANNISVSLLPAYMLLFLILMAVMYKYLLSVCRK